MDQVGKELVLRNKAYDFADQQRDQSRVAMSFEYLLDAIKSSEYGMYDIRAIASGLEQCIHDRGE